MSLYLYLDLEICLYKRMCVFAFLANIFQLRFFFIRQRLIEVQLNEDYIEANEAWWFQVELNSNLIIMCLWLNSNPMYFHLFSFVDPSTYTFTHTHIDEYIATLSFTQHNELNDARIKQMLHLIWLSIRENVHKSIEDNS